MRSKNPFVSLVIPLYNEADNLLWHQDKIDDFFSNHDYKYEIIYIDDGSEDGSLDIVKQLANEKPHVRYVGLSRNFGKEAATTAGLQSSTGDVVVVMDADGQHPVKMVSNFIDEWQHGFDVVVGVRKANTDEGFIKRNGSKLHSSLLTLMTGDRTLAGATDFRLVDRKVVDEFNRLTERSRITRGLIDWLGFKRTYVDFVSPARHSGEAKYTFGKLVRLALHSFTSQSTKPLQTIGLLGVVVTIISFLAGVFLVLEKYLFNDFLNLSITGTGLLAIFLSFLVGLVLSSQGLLAIYIESIHTETQNRPLFIISDQSK